MNTFSTNRSNAKGRTYRKLTGMLTTVLLAGLLCGITALQGFCTPHSPHILLGDAEDGYTDVTAYCQVYSDGTEWVVGFDGEDPFEIVLDAANGQVLDPTGRQIGIITQTEPAPPVTPVDL